MTEKERAYARWLLAFTDSSDPLQRARALRELGRLGHVGARAIGLMVASLENEQLRSAAFDALECLGDAGIDSLGAARAFLETRPPAYRPRTAWALERLEHYRTVPR